MSCTVSLFTLALLAARLAQAQVSIPSNASELALEEANAQYINEGFPNTNDTVGFGVPLESQAILTVDYNGTLVQATGQSMTQQQVASLPTIYVTPSTSSASNFSTSSTFTLMLADASAIGYPDPQGNFRHFLSNSLTAGSPTSSSNTTFVLSGGLEVTYYAGPEPGEGEGPHRYAWLLVDQPSTFKAPANLSQAGTSPNHWSVQQYIEGSGLGSVVAAAFFTVENGPANYTVAPTSSVNPSTLPAASATGAPSTGASKSGAGQLAVGAAGTAIMGLAGLVGLAMM